jgi:hypothetical protein
MNYNISGYFKRYLYTTNLYSVNPHLFISFVRTQLRMHSNYIFLLLMNSTQQIEFLESTCGDDDNGYWDKNRRKINVFSCFNIKQIPSFKTRVRPLYCQVIVQIRYK